MSIAVKKLLKRYGRTNRIHLSQIWPDIEEGLLRLLNDLNDGFTIEECMRLYSLVYDYCTGKGSGFKFSLYNRVESLLKRHMNNIIRKTESAYALGLVQCYIEEWEKYMTAMKVIDHIFLFLNIYSKQDETEVYEIYQLGVVIWNENIFKKVGEKFIRSILSLIEKSRDGEKVDISLIKSSIRCLADSKEPDGSSLYTKYFSDLLITETRYYYESEALEYISNGNISLYLKYIEESLQDEETRVTYLPEETNTPLIIACRSVLISDQLDTFEDNFLIFLNENKYEDVNRIYKYLLTVGDIQNISELFKVWVQGRGDTELNGISPNEYDNPQVYSDALLRVYELSHAFIKKSFNKDKLFSGCLDTGMKRFVNQNPVTMAAKTSTKSAELLAKYTNIILSKDSKLSEKKTERKLNGIILMFKLLEDKDVFQTFYRNLLGRRLLYKSSKSESLEAFMISKLQPLSSADYYSKVSRMLQDIDSSRILESEFKEHGSDKYDYKFSVEILTFVYWPIKEPKHNFLLPPELLPCLSSFENFFTEKYPLKKLMWVWEFSKAEIRSVNAFKEKYFIQGTMFQASIMLAFNQQDILSWDDLSNITDLPPKILQNVLTFLVKSKILHVSPKNSTKIGTKNKFKINAGYQQKKKKLNLSLVEERRPDAEADFDTKRSTLQNRNLYIQAALIRVIKKNNEMAYNDLISQTVEVLKDQFKPSIPVIKKNIDDLIAKDYMKRKTGDMEVLQYT
eukprot:TRINITY_DN9194_c0_g1_i1.p1 TRINITY_DN9194_c0_g1~~TRINITY_DN9194_c0_g1_i1.p1  ORF type:complete len:738 (+),score=157.28 TRINITY_DN9194_c0_g1_i1:25-2238(+)